MEIFHEGIVKLSRIQWSGVGNQRQQDYPFRVRDGFHLQWELYTNFRFLVHWTG